MIIFLTTNGDEFQTPGSKVEYKPSVGYGSEGMFEVHEEDGWKPVAQVRACEVIGWYVIPEPEPE